MGQYNQAVLTTAGQALLTSILGNAGTLTFSKFQTSSYQYASGTDLSALTSLQSVEQNVVPSAGGIKDATTFYSSSTVPNTGVTVEYTNYTVGLFATDGDDEVLFAVSTAIVPDIIPVDDGGVPSTYTYTMSIGVSSTENFTVEVDDQGILRVTSIVDNLNSTSATQPLSANQGKVLNDAKQPKTLATPLTIGGTSQTTVEGALGGLITVKAERADITSISCTGATNDTGATILNGSEFYLNGVLCKAIADIANGATFTLNTNYETTTVADDLAELNSNLRYKLLVANEQCGTETPFVVSANKYIVNAFYRSTSIQFEYVPAMGALNINNGFFVTSGSGDYARLKATSTGLCVDVYEHNGQPVTSLSTYSIFYR